MTIVFPPCYFKIVLNLGPYILFHIYLHQVLIHTYIFQGTGGKSTITDFALITKFYHRETEKFLIKLLVFWHIYNIYIRPFTYGLMNPEHLRPSTVTYIVNARKVILRMKYLTLTLDIIVTI